jgi:hypothetical protein
VSEYDVASDTWRTLAPISSARGSVNAIVLNGKINAIGGRKNETDLVPAHEVYDPMTDKRSAAAPLPKDRDHMAAVTVDGKLHVVGGRFGENEDMPQTKLDKKLPLRHSIGGRRTKPRSARFQHGPFSALSGLSALS